jgi:hypothetical protein
MRNRALVRTVACSSALGLIAGLGLIALLEPAGAAYGPKAKYDTQLTGAAETSPPGGDPDGTGFASVKVKSSKSSVCVVIKKVLNIGTITAAHIHEAPAGADGPIVVTLATPTAKKPGKKAKSKTCVNASTALINDLISYPADFYVNVHSSAFPGGAIRGQLA